MFHCPDENTEPPASAETPPPPATANPEPVVEAKQETDSQMAPPTELAAQSAAPTPAPEVPTPSIKDQPSPAPLPPAATSTPPPAEAVNKVETKVGDTVDAPVVPSASLAAQEVPVKMEEPQATPAPAEKVLEKEEKKTEEVEKLEKLEKEEQTTSAKLEPAIEVKATVTPVNVAKVETPTKTATEVSQPPPPAQEPAAPPTQTAAPEPEATLAETAEPLLSNGLPQDTEELPEDMAFPDTTPLDKPDASQSQESTPVAKTATPAQEEEKEEEKEEDKKEEEGKEKSEDAPPASVSCPTEESTMQGRLE